MQSWTFAKIKPLYKDELPDHTKMATTEARAQAGRRSPGGMQQLLKASTNIIACQWWQKKVRIMPGPSSSVAVRLVTDHVIIIIVWRSTYPSSTHPHLPAHRKTQKRRKRKTTDYLCVKNPIFSRRDHPCIQENKSIFFFDDTQSHPLMRWRNIRRALEWLLTHTHTHTHTHTLTGARK